MPTSRDDAQPPDALPPIARREALQRLALLWAGAALAPALEACDGRGTSGGTAANGAWTPRVLTGERGEQVAVVVDHILPATDTPGARALRVHEYVDLMLAEVYPADERARFLAGLADVDARAQRRCGRPFLACSAAEQRALLARLDRQTFAAPGARPPAPGADARTQPGAGAAPVPPELEGDTLPDAPFEGRTTECFRTLKELTLVGYYTSRVGATRELHYDAVPGRYDGCVAVDAAWRAAAV